MSGPHRSRRWRAHANERQGEAAEHGPPFPPPFPSRRMQRFPFTFQGGPWDDPAAWCGPEEHKRRDFFFFRRWGPGDDDPSGEGGGGRPRHRRGDIKYALLELLAAQPRHGYELIKELENRYGGFYRPSPGSVYPTLQLLEDEGYLTSEQVEGKRVYTITEAGRTLLAERQQQRPGPHGLRPEGAGADLSELRWSAAALADSVMQVARHGTPEQVRAAIGLLDTTRREIYRMLARDEGEA